MATVSSLKRSLGIAILAVMALALFVTRPHSFPDHSDVGVHGDEKTCLSNLNQIARAYALYARDYDDKIPRGVDPEDHSNPSIWRRPLDASFFNHTNIVSYDPYGTDFSRDAATAPYLHLILRPYVSSPEIFHCPADVGWTRSLLGPTTLSNIHPSSFALFGTSYYCFTKYGFLQITAADIVNPSQTLLLFDGDLWHSNRNGPILNGLFADGHVQNMTANQFTGYAGL